MQSIAPQELHNTIRDYVATLKRQSVAGILSTYLIFDPTETDPLEASSFGVPFYVGQGDIVHRAKDHLCGRSGVLTRRRIQTIYERGQHPRFLVVAHTRSRLTSLKSEMDWVCHLHGLGYALTNGWRGAQKGHAVAGHACQTRMAVFGQRRAGGRCQSSCPMQSVWLPPTRVPGRFTEYRCLVHAPQSSS